jgi:hypothetical protein
LDFGADRTCERSAKDVMRGWLPHLTADLARWHCPCCRNCRQDFQRPGSALQGYRTGTLQASYETIGC